MPASELIERVAAIIVETEPVVPDAVRPELRRLGERLREPLRVEGGKSGRVGLHRRGIAPVTCRAAPPDPGVQVVQPGAGE